MKKGLLYVFAVILLFSTDLYAQNPQRPEGVNRPQFGQGERMNAEKRAEKMATDLQLTAEQKTSVKALFEKYDGLFDKLRAEGDRQSPDFRTKMREMRDAQEKELKAIIGEEKFTKYMEMRKDRRGNEPKKENN